MSQKSITITGWTLTALLGLVFAMSAISKFSQDASAAEHAAAMGLDVSTLQFIAFVEIISFILFAIPRTGILGTLLLAAYLGGAIVTHLEHQQPMVMAVAIQALLWITAVIRFPELRQRLFATQKA